MTPEQAEALAARIVAALDAHGPGFRATDIYPAELERVASDLAGLRAHEDCGAWHHGDGPCADERRYADGLRRTARLYGVAEQHRHQPGWPCHNPRCPDA